jgi:hypothetical protein
MVKIVFPYLPFSHVEHRQHVRVSVSVGQRGLQQTQTIKAHAAARGRSRPWIEDLYLAEVPVFADLENKKLKKGN